LIFPKLIRSARDGIFTSLFGKLVQPCLFSFYRRQNTGALGWPKVCTAKTNPDLLWDESLAK
jgi:hypothetical protein